jgi:hypothetical protein
MEGFLSVVVPSTKTMLSRSASILRHPQQLHTSREYISNWNRKMSPANHQKLLIFTCLRIQQITEQK